MNHRLFLCILLIWVHLISVVPAEKPDTRRIVTRHQQYRALTQAADMMLLTWSQNLESIADFVVQKCPESVEEIRMMPEVLGLGVNIGTAPYPTPMLDGYPEDVPTSIIDQWGAERSNFFPDSGCQLQPCDSWWQIVWSNTSQVGCSLNVCGDKSVMICLYNIGADMKADFPFKPGKGCSACPKGYTVCRQDMCTPDEDTTVEPKSELLPSSFMDDPIETIEEGEEKEDDDDGTANRLTVALLFTTIGLQFL